MLSRIIMASQIKSVRWAFNCGSWSPSEQQWQLLASGLDAEDKEQVGKFVFKKDAISGMVGRFLTKKYVSEATGLAWRDIKISRDSVHKKPYFSQESFTSCKIQFNISHSGDFVIIAGEVGDLELGVDLMKVEKQRTTTVPEFFRLMSKQFATEEWAVVKSQKSEAEQMAMFYRFWCLKESYTKATGTGITVDLQQICFKLNNFCLGENVVVDDTEAYVDGIKQDGWKFEESVINNHIATVAIHTSDVCFKFPSEGQLFKTLSYSELISQYQQISEMDIDYTKTFMTKKKRP